ncbi:alginate export family protein [Rhodanobacter thiooxydans]|uniref:alginate export family protein n=1 Tax=Rhodanobacter thiooxydans TaxID=416169 RepID=UPI000D39826F|nr:alginate export family protein [Rhodanobacter thiooxydans]
MKHARNHLSAACLLAILAAPAWAAGTTADAGGPAASAPSWQLEWDARLRHEQVDDDAFARDARADTLRLRLGLHGEFGHGWSGLVEGAGVASAGDRYNSGANGRTLYPAVTDPRGGEFNQYWLRWQGDRFGASAGRQRLLLDNQRWVGSVGWRQHEQTFDAVELRWQPLAALTVRYDWLDRVHRVAGRDALNPLARERKLNTHLLNLGWTQDAQQWTGYAYLHEDRDVASASSATYGVRWSGKALRQGNGLGWTLEGARQYDYANNPQHFAHGYWLLEPSWTQSGITAKLGWEHLGGNGRHALQTPLATLHAFNGWDDQFGVTPAGGLEDRYAGVNGNFGRHGVASKLGWAVAYHDYRADRGGRYGSEWDASLAFALAQGLSGLLKVANYRADGFGRDSAKLWLQLEWRGQRALAGAR